MNDSTIQIMDITSLKAVLSDLRKNVVPSRIEKIQQSDPHTLQIAFRTLKRLIWIEISWCVDSARIVEIDLPKKINGESTLSKQIRFGTRGMALIELKQNGFERIVEFCLAFRPNQEFKKYLIIELMGKHSNFFFLDERKHVIALGKQIRIHQSRLRPISTGDIYTPPPPLTGLVPKQEDSIKSWKERLSLLPIPLKTALKQTFQGISPALSVQLASENLEEAKTLLNLPIQEISEIQWKNLYSRWNSWIKTLEEENFCMSFEGPSHYRVWPFNISYTCASNNISLQIGRYYKAKLQTRKFIDQTNQLSQTIIRQKETESKALTQQEELYKKISNIDTLQKKANTILCQSNPSKNDIKEAQMLYSRVKKIRRSESILLERINYHKTRLLFIKETEFFLEYIINNALREEDNDVESIINLKEDIEEHLSIKKQRANKKIIRLKSSQNIYEVKSPNGLTIQIGRNHRQNELISLKKARKGDIWFHAQGCPGSHVMLKGANGQVEDNDLQVGADLASLFSKAKQNKEVSVLMVPARQLQKPKGAPPGMVSPRKSKIIWGNPSNGEKYLEQLTKNA